MNTKPEYLPTQRVVIFTSPNAGSGANREEVPRLVERLKQAKIQVQVTSDPNDLTSASQATSAGTVVVAAGGDGTITLAASRLVDEASASQDPSHLVPLVPMPLGTENLLARHFGHRSEAASVMQTIQQGSPHTIDLGMIQQLCPNGNAERPSHARLKPMLTMATCGFDADVVRSLHLRRKGHIWRGSYFAPIARAMTRYRFPELTVETISSKGNVDQVLPCGWAMVFNLPCYAAGLAIEPHAVGDDGQFDVVAFHGRSVVSGLRYLAGIKTGRHLNFSDVTRLRAASIRIRSTSRVHYQIDGDHAGRLPIQINMRPAAVTLLRPV